MDRLEWSDTNLVPGEEGVNFQSGIAIYDGQDKTYFENGTLTLTTHRVIWKDNRDRTRVLALQHSLVVYIEEQPSGFAKSAKIAVHVSAAGPGKKPGPVTNSRYDYIRFSFREAGEGQFFRDYNEQLQQRKWEHVLPPRNPAATAPRHRAGIMGIEQTIQQTHANTDKNISQAFQDLTKLMEKAKEMVTLSKTIANKIKDKQGEVTDDETIKFKSYLLSMGIPNPVTRETHGSGDKYYTELARQLSNVLEKPLKEYGGIMTLTDVYCRVNRARGMELLSPEDLLNACEMFEILRLPVRLKTFDSGVMVLQLQSHNEEQVIHLTTQLVEEKGSLTAEDLSKEVGVSVILAKERLLLTEKVGGICRDECVEGLRFYSNLFLTKVT
ncbi:vacuolar protein-sorting-associated protein 36-like [Ostrea edulis]|uniref:vacuolar protein-sorting-associated protein 36-like n=1 Tax=Ostrea edulis TaxID=37623 RepID=UPI0024AF7DC6|nr:vacuolar protein-sorting-associated protein 36-like [Ostrea edulis]XP_056012938.1 vacuolar protein-sorting-associated protein 36-like [Ostrea edulis]